jgi:hypothetical protein
VRAADMKTGQTYLTNRGLTVTYLDTPDAVRAQQRVRVRFADGIGRGNVRDLPTRNIVRACKPCPEDKKPSPQRTVAVPTIVKLTRTPQVGDNVIVEVAGELRWTIEAIDAERGEATITTPIFGEPQTKTAPLNALTVCEERKPSMPRSLARPVEAQPPKSAKFDPRPRQQPPPPTHRLAKPTDTFMERLIFTPRCLAEAKKRLDLRQHDPAEQLREEVRRDGVLVKRGHGEYIRVRVPKRFDIVFTERPGEDELVDIDRLRYPARTNRKDASKQQHGRRQRPAA